MGKSSSLPLWEVVGGSRAGMEGPIERETESPPLSDILKKKLEWGGGHYTTMILSPSFLSPFRTFRLCLCSL